MTSQATTTATASAPAKVRVRRPNKKPNQHGSAGFLFTVPFMILFLGLFIAPLVYALYLSMFREQLIGGNTFVALDNYVDAFSDKAFGRGIGRVALFMVVQMPIMLVLALVFALILDSGRVWFPKLFRVGFFVPYAIPTVIAALMWGFLYGQEFGPLTDISDSLGLGRPDFLGRGAMLFSIANVST